MASVRSHCCLQRSASAPVSEQKMFSFLLLHFVFIYETKAECTAVYYFGEKLQPKPDLFFRIWQHNRSPLSLKSAAPHVSSVAVTRWVLISRRSVPSIRFKFDFASAAGFLLSNSYWIIKGEATLRCAAFLCFVFKDKTVKRWSFRRMSVELCTDCQRKGITVCSEYFQQRFCVTGIEKPA